MSSDPASVVNRALDEIGRSDLTIGELEEGTEAAKPALRAYGPTLRQLLRASHWDFARKQTPLVLLADATGQMPNVGTIVQAPWSFCYELPIDCMKVRFLPWNSNPVGVNPPLMTGLAQPALNSIRLQPAPFLVALDSNYPVVTGAPKSWDQVPEWWTSAGTGPTQRTVINTNVPPQPQGSSAAVCPSLVYTSLVVYPSQWDSLFEEAMVQVLAQRLAMPLNTDKKLGMAIRNQCIATAKEMITQARAVNANESGAPQSVDHLPDFIRVRSGGSSWGASGLGCDSYGSGFGIGFGRWDGFSFSDGSIF